MIRHPVHLRYRGRPSLDVTMLTYYACPECCQPRTWCRCEGSGDA